jgi:Arc/MetJ-type ribon-helix-helix transcriptional regulator
LEVFVKTIQTEIPEQLYKKALSLVKEGWFRDEKDVFSEAIRRFLETHRPELMEKLIRDDVEWGLHGHD